jgi:hypothetical protein
MPAMTYDSLVAEIKSYLDRTDASTTDRIPDFISQAEQRIARESKNLGIETYVVGTFIPSVSVYPKPARWRRNLSLNFGTGTPANTRNQLYLRKYEYLRQYWPDSTLTGTPKYYSDYGYNNFLIAPTPDSAYPFEYCYLQLPEPITSTNQTNWLTNYAPDVLLYACLLEAVPFLKNDERIPVWEKYYDRALSSLEAQNEMRLEDRASNARSG